jgi:hypothetical protein
MTHARRAASLIVAVADEVGPCHLGLNLTELAAIATDVADRPPTATSGKDAAVAVVFTFRLEPREIRPR